MCMERSNAHIMQLRETGEQLYGDMVKAVVDVEKEIMAVGAELHADEEAFLLERRLASGKLVGNQFVHRSRVDGNG